MAKFFINRPIFAIVIAIIITLAGSIAAFNLPIAQYPQITPPQVSVSTTYTGANADVVEKSVAQVIEQQVNGVEGAVAMSSTSADTGRYSLNVKFELGQNPDMVTMYTQNRVAQANAGLPQDVQTNGVTTRKVSPDTVLYFSLISPDGSYDSVFLKNYGSINIIDDIRRVKGVGDISEYGTDFSMRIWLKPDKLAQLGITASDIATAIKEQNVQAPAGTIGQLPSVAQQEFQYTASVQGRLVTEEDFRKVIIRSQPDGSAIRLGDIATVELGAKDNTFKSSFNGQDSVVFAVQLTTDANALETVNGVHKVIEDAAKRFPPGMEYRVLSDNTKYIRESIEKVVHTFFEALALVLIIVYLFLQNWRATLIPMLAIPVSLVGTFGAFVVLGFSINTLTLFAMVLAIGLVVDDAIVVVEAVEHHMRYSGLNPKEATIRAMEEVSGPVVAIAFVLASVFIPVAFFGGTTGVLYKQFALTIAVSMALSAIVALSLTPALCSLLLKPYTGEQRTGLLGRFFDRFNLWFEQIIEKYSHGVQQSIRRARLWGVGLVVIAVLCVGMLRVLPSTFVPSEDQGFFLSVVSLPEASNMNRTRAIAKQVGEIYRSLPGVENTMEVAGFDILAGGQKPNGAMVGIGLTPWSERTTPDTQLKAVLGQAMAQVSNIPEATVFAFNLPSLPGIGTVGGLTFMIQDRGGASLEEMNTVSQQFIAAARKRPEFAMVQSSFRADTPAYRYEVNREKAKALGVPVQDIFTALQTFLGGVQVNDFNRFGRTYKVMLQAEPEFRADADATRFFYVRSSSGTMVPLNTLVTPTPTSGQLLIKRFNGYPAMQINATAAPGYSSGQAMDAMEQIAAEVLPRTFTYEWADLSREEKLSSGHTPVIFGLALLFVFLCLAALYESWNIPFAVLLSVPTGILGSTVFQYARGLENSIYMQIGLVMLIGLAAKNAILIVEYAKVRTDKGMEPVQAAIEASKLRLRPILMTSLAFILGCIPLAMSTGAGAAARTALGTTVVGGMLFATSLGIFLVPVLFVAIEYGTAKLKAFKTGHTRAS
ncbi:efflux RND transporter permease subunit [Sporomusa acidovorans]|uniref:Efflux pump membrane transporter BepE n=1 Tax=Sporomusa acidovorans (strain ATCC 49682 / DSM 3132 / Mol) TaxID=1123286 RepID=A0ABZ3J161_SPOA4|nr:multidrug efflux RND transporter permease subunit [Sporomusa acidovorans]OZC22837.1 efflux pump membrane transporter BepE [Sporomusa acidovorans DSM 3132]SDE52474.1 hydrophobe/amphiphile efflux-1 (HAE1) family protein [Sporomusa acidovorans]